MRFFNRHYIGSSLCIWFYSASKLLLLVSGAYGYHSAYVLDPEEILFNNANLFKVRGLCQCIRTQHSDSLPGKNKLFEIRINEFHVFSLT